MRILLFPWAKQMRNGEKHPKNYIYWGEVVDKLAADGHTLVQVGAPGEDKIVDDFRAGLSIREVEELILECDTWIGVDSFGQHLAWSLGKKGIAIFGQSDPHIFGHPENINLLKGREYLREKQFWLWEQCAANDECWVDADTVVGVLYQNFS